VKKFSLVLLLLFSGCSIFSPYSSKFSCPGYHPGTCASIPEVYRMYKRGAFSDIQESKSMQESATYRPLKCSYKTVCSSCGNPLVGERKCCRQEKYCVPDSVSKHVDYRAEAVRDNANKETVVW
jgi:hypothetical protein